MDCVECDIILWLRGLSVGRLEVDAGSLAGGARSSGKGFHHSKPNARSQRKLSSHDMSIERRAYTILLSAVQLYSQVTRVGVQVRNETSLAARVHACLHLTSNTDTHDFCQHTADQHGLAQPISHQPSTTHSRLATPLDISRLASTRARAPTKIYLTASAKFAINCPQSFWSGSHDS